MAIIIQIPQAGFSFLKDLLIKKGDDGSEPIPFSSLIDKTEPVCHVVIISDQYKTEVAKILDKTYKSGYALRFDGIPKFGSKVPNTLKHVPFQAASSSKPPFASYEAPRGRDRTPRDFSAQPRSDRSESVGRSRDKSRDKSPGRQIFSKMQNNLKTVKPTEVLIIDAKGNPFALRDVLHDRGVEMVGVYQKGSNYKTVIFFKDQASAAALKGEFVSIHGIAKNFELRGYDAARDDQTWHKRYLKSSEFPLASNAAGSQAPAK